MIDLKQVVSYSAYPGRGIIIGRSGDGASAVCAYFIMGRSENSRNRVFVAEGAGLRTQAHDASKLIDPSLIIYAPVRVLGRHTIVTNGDQTDTVYDALAQGETFEEALRTRTFEPDAPNYTPRISGLLTVFDGDFAYRLSILKSEHGDPSGCCRFFYEYENPLAGQGHFIHTYAQDGDPLLSFEGEPKGVAIEGDIDQMTQTIWENLDEENRVSLFVRFMNIQSREFTTRIVNKNV